MRNYTKCLQEKKRAIYGRSPVGRRRVGSTNRNVRWPLAVLHFFHYFCISLLPPPPLLFKNKPNVSLSERKIPIYFFLLKAELSVYTRPKGVKKHCERRSPRYYQDIIEHG